MTRAALNVRLCFYMHRGNRLNNYCGFQIALNRIMFICGARINNTNLQPPSQRAGALGIGNDSQCSYKASNIKDVVSNCALMDSIHTLLIELFCNSKVLFGKHVVVTVGLQCCFRRSFKLSDDTTGLFEMQSVKTRHGSLILLHDTLVVCVLSAEQDTVLVHLNFTSTREEQEASTVSQRVGKRREEVGLRW